MNKIKELFFGSKQDKLTDKAFTQSIAVSVISILVCVVALCSVTWAWFSSEISSSSSDIKSAYCDVNVTVVSEDSKLESIGGKYSFLKDKAYKIQISATGTAETAYCILKIDDVDYYTAQIPTQTIDNYIVFTLQFEAEVTEVEVITRWGTSSVPAANRHFVNNGQYLNCIKVESLPKAVPDTKPDAETISAQSNNTEPPVAETTTSEATAEISNEESTFPETTTPEAITETPNEETTTTETTTDPVDTEPVIQETTVAEPTGETTSHAASSEVNE